MNKIYKTKAEVLSRAKEAIGLTILEIDKTGRIATGKGAVGNIVEESWFDLKVNNESRPDFEEAGVELKVTPYKKLNNGAIRAKERLVCNVINYMEENLSDFYNSSFWHKCNTILLMSYEYIKGIHKGDYTIDNAILFSFPKEDLVIIQNDWNTIMSKIKAGKAHEISESDTMYLAACTKGATAAKSFRPQPFSSVPAKQRAYSLKQSYMTYVLNSFIFGNEKDPNIIKDISDLRDKTFEEYVVDELTPYIGKTELELREELNVTSKAKNVNELFLAKMLGISGRISETAEFKKANIVPKTIRVNEDGSITEHMSFPHRLLKNIAEEEWDTSAFREYLTQTKFLFIIFKFVNKELVFDRVQFWNVSDKDLEEIENVWIRTQKIILEGVKLVKRGNRIFNNLPSSSENQICHVRPHARNANDVMQLPDGRCMPKQCFWFNNSYIEKQI